MVAVGAVIENPRLNKILVIQRALDQDFKGGMWEIGYGRIDQFEDPEAGLKREIREETGLEDITIGETLSVWHLYRGPKNAENDLIGITYHATTYSEKITLSKEHAAYRWVEPSEALELIEEEGVRRDVSLFIELKKHKKLKIGREVIGVGVGALIFNDENKLLLTLRGKKAKNEVGKWEIPGGAIEFGETLKVGLQREIQEELDIEIRVGEMLQLCDHIIPDEHQHWVSPTYLCTILNGTPRIMEPEKCEKIGWFTLEEAAQLPLSLVTQEDINILLKQKKT